MQYIGKKRRGEHLDKLMLCPLQLHITKKLKLEKVNENSSLNNEKDSVSLLLSKVPVQNCFSKYPFRWFAPDDELREISAKETCPNQALLERVKLISVPSLLLPFPWYAI